MMDLHLRLTRKDLINMVRGCSPSYAVMEHPLVKPYFRYYDHPQHQEWRGLEKLSEVELWTMYLICEPRSKEEV